MVFNSSFEKYFHLWSENGQKFCLKDGSFGTLDFNIENALDEFKINQKMLLKHLFIDILNYFYLIIECQIKNTQKCHKIDIRTLIFMILMPSYQ